MTDSPMQPQEDAGSAETTEQSEELRRAWAELTEAARAAGVNSLQACTRNGTAWEADPAAVRFIAATIRGIEDRDPGKLEK